MGAHIQQMAQQGVLCRVGVLHFIDQQITHAQPPLGADIGVLVEEAHQATRKGQATHAELAEVRARIFALLGR